MLMSDFVCTSLCTAGVDNIAQNSSDDHPYDHLIVANADGDTTTLSLLSVRLCL